MPDALMSKEKLEKLLSRTDHMPIDVEEKTDHHTAVITCMAQEISNNFYRGCCGAWHSCK